MEGAVAVGERTGLWYFASIFGQNLNAFVGRHIFFRDDDPGNDLEGADSGKNDEQCSENANRFRSHQ